MSLDPAIVSAQASSQIPHVDGDHNHGKIALSQERPVCGLSVNVMSTAQRIIIRVDASVTMGMGHLMRCISLANELAKNGSRIVFLTRSHAAGLRALIEGHQHDVRLLPDPQSPVAVTPWLPTTWQHDAEQTSEAIGEIGAADLLIVDHYGLDARWENMQRKLISRILVIDDVADRPHDCDLLLDQNLVAQMDSRYEGLVPADCRLLLGPSFALLGPAFAEQRGRMTCRSGEVRRVLVCYGGSDPSNETAKALAAIKSLSALSLTVDVVVGGSNPHVEAVSAICAALPRASLHRDVNNMAKLMAEADISIGAGGIMNWERCCLGLPTIAMDIADNQVGGLRALAHAGAVAYLGPAGAVDDVTIACEIQSLKDQPAKARKMGLAAKSLVDGDGVRRVVSAIASC